MLKRWDALGYSQHSKLQFEVGYDFLFGVHGNKFSGNKDVLDIGCGNGQITKEIAHRVLGQVIGIDYTQEMIELARKQNAATNINYYVMDAQKISFPSRKFDIVASTFCLQWIADKAAAFRGIKQHLKKDGDVLLIMPLFHKELSENRTHLMENPPWQKYFINYQNLHETVKDDVYDRYAKEAGLNNIELITKPITTNFENRFYLQEFLRNISPFLYSLATEELRDEFMEEYINSYLNNPKHGIKPDGSCNITFNYAMLAAQN